MTSDRHYSSDRVGHSRSASDRGYRRCESQQRGENDGRAQITFGDMQGMDSEISEKKVLSLSELLLENMRTLKRFYYLPIVFSLICAVGLCFYSKFTFNPVYCASATFTVEVTNVSSLSNSPYSIAAARQLSLSFSHILTSGALSNLIAHDLELTELPATITAETEGETNLLTMSVFSSMPHMSYDILQSAMENYPKVADFVVGNTSLTLLSDSGIPTDPINAISYKDEAIKGALLGCCLSMVLIITLTLTKKTVRDIGDIKSMLNLRCIGTIPFVEMKKRSNHTHRMLLSVNENASKAFEDSMRLIRSRVQKTCDENDYRVILVTGSISDEGKTTVATNVAMLLALNGRKVALLDCDIRKRSSEYVPSLRNEFGIVEYLSGFAPLSKIADTPIDNLIDNLMFIKGKAFFDDTTDPFSAEKMNRLLEQLLEEVDFVILDSPPAAIMADAVILANFADCILYVIRQGVTHKSRIVDGITNLCRSNTAFLGYVLNGSKESNNGYGYGNYSRYGKYSGKSGRREMRGRYDGYRGYRNSVKQ